jgi:nucleoside-diphosphate-sugar epimerase
MKSIYLTGSTGFVGTKLIESFKPYFIINRFNKGSRIDINEDIVINLVGKTEDKEVASDFDEYYQINTEFSNRLFDAFLVSKAQIFITISSVKAVANEYNFKITEEHIPNPKTFYGKSKLLAENYILSKKLPNDKSFYILRPSLIYGAGNKGNLKFLYRVVSKLYIWPFGAFENKRTYCAVENLIFTIKEFLNTEGIPSGIYNVCDDEALSTNELIQLIACSKKRKPVILKIPKTLIIMIISAMDYLIPGVRNDFFTKLTSSLNVSNAKLKKVLGKNLPISSKDGLLNTFKSFY